ncbi:ubiquitin-conjugating enzyme/RWD-like protein [Panaeolus papilionaceus]|nr:ubiquitin-conjugating enzyme/RWD-like protein [Panaeolus papilionaceus]
MTISPAVVRRIMRELGEMEKNPPEGIRIQSNDEDMLDFVGLVEGPQGTPYAGGYFKVKFTFNDEFPAAPPKCRFATKIFHPNVGPTGEICVSTLKKDWKPTYGIAHILVTVKCLLIYPNPESALDEEAGKLLLEDYASYCSRAKLITSVHATPRVKPVEFNTPSAPQDDKESASKPTTSDTPSQPTASTSKAATPVSSTSTPSITTSVSSPRVPSTTSRKSASPGPQNALKSLPSDKEGLSAHPQKERYPSPSPLSTADANVGTGGKPIVVGLGMASTAGVGGVTGTKAVKRAATNSATSGAEKRKKALKRL